MNFNKIFEFTKNNISIFLTLLFVTIVNFTNIFNNPYYINDEAIYTSQGWASFNLNQLSVYTYWYDHAPAGWLFIGAFYHFFENLLNINDLSIATGRVFVGILLILTNLMFAHIVYKTFNNNLAVIFALLFFNISKLNITYHRFIVLDNIMIFWLVVSIWLLHCFRPKFFVILFSAMALGISILSKESAVVFYLPILFYVYYNSSKSTKFVKTVLYFCTSIGVILLYPILAIFKTELFPTKDKVSLLGTILFHSKRGKGLPFYNLNSEIRTKFADWYYIDPVMSTLILFSVLTPIFLFFVKVNKKMFYLVYSMHLLYILFLIRGGTVLNIYVIPLLFTTAWLYTIVLEKLWLYLANKKVLQNSLIIVVFICIALFQTRFIKDEIFQYDANENHKKVLKWVRQNLKEDDVIALDQTWLDLNHPRDKSNKVFKNSEWFFKFDEDPQIKKEILENKWQNLDYLIATEPMYDLLENNDIPLIRTALNNSKLIQEFKPEDRFTVSQDGLYSVNGDWAAVWRVNDNQKAMDTIYKQYLQTYTNQQGQTIDSETSFTFSYDQSENLMRSYQNNDKASFELFYNWTKSNMLRKDKLLAKSFGTYQNQVKILDQSPDIYANILYSLTLSKAGIKWNNEEYKQKGAEISNIMWDTLVTETDDWAVIQNNPEEKSNFTKIKFQTRSLVPAYIQELKSFSNKNWDKVIATDYQLVNKILDLHHLLPSEVEVDMKSKSVNLLLNPKINNFGETSFIVPINIALDNKYNFRPEAKIASTRISERLQKTVEKYGIVPSNINPDGTSPDPDFSSSKANTAAIAILFDTNIKLANKLYRTKNSNIINVDYTLDDKSSRDHFYSWVAFAIHEEKYDFVKK
jgi:endo-1,4-beta-D-glucanase Y